MDKLTRDTLIGLAAGAGLGGLAGYAIPSGRSAGRRRGGKASGPERFRRIRNAVLGALVGGGAGAVAGRVARNAIDFHDALKHVRPDGVKKVPGKLYFINYPDNKGRVYQSGNPIVDNAARKIMDATGWSGELPLGHASLVKVDDNGDATIVNPISPQPIKVNSVGPLAKKPSDIPTENVYFESWKLPGNFKGKSTYEAAKASSQGGYYGNRTVAYEIPVEDVGVVDRFLEYEKKRKSAYSCAPGGANCGTMSRMIVDLAGKNPWLNFLKSILVFGTPSMNAPSLGTSKGEYVRLSSPVLSDLPHFSDYERMMSSGDVRPVAIPDNIRRYLKK